MVFFGESVGFFYVKKEVTQLDQRRTEHSPLPIYLRIGRTKKPVTWKTYVRTREKAEHGVYSAESSPEEYAADRFSGGTETVTYETAHQTAHQFDNIQ